VTELESILKTNLLIVGAVCLSVAMVQVCVPLQITYLISVLMLKPFSPSPLFFVVSNGEKMPYLGPNTCFCLRNVV
jgi:hypothetical protein